MSSKKRGRDASALAPPHSELMGRELSEAVIFFHEAVASHLGMTAAEWKVLGLLSQHGASAAGRLSELSNFTTGAITGIVDRLERAGYVRREAHPTDRRSVIIQPLNVQAIQERAIPIFQSLMNAMSAVASRYSAEELARIASFFAETTSVLRNETAKLKHQRQPSTSGDRSSS